MKVEAVAARGNLSPGSQAAQEQAPATRPAAEPAGREGRQDEAVRFLDRELLPVSEKIVLEAIDKANRAIQGANTQLEFSVHEKTGDIMVKVKNSETGEVIREIPPEKILDLVAKIWEMLGILVDKKV